MYGDFDFYKNKYGGKNIKNESDFKRFAEKSCSYIDMQTFSRLKVSDISEDILYKVKLCECELAEVFEISERSAGIVSENNDGYSVTYENSTATGFGKEKLDILTRYLWDTGYLYRGMCQ